MADLDLKEIVTVIRFEKDKKTKIEKVLVRNSARKEFKIRKEDLKQNNLNGWIYKDIAWNCTATMRLVYCNFVCRILGHNPFFSTMQRSVFVALITKSAWSDFISLTIFVNCSAPRTKKGIRVGDEVRIVEYQSDRIHVH